MESAGRVARAHPAVIASIFMAKPLQVDYLVIGAGVAGLRAAV